MGKYRNRAALFMIQPWTNLRCDEDQYYEILKFANILKKRKIPIIYETYSSYFLEDIYNLADIRIIYRIKDMNDILEHVQQDHAGLDYSDQRDDANPTDMADAYQERYGDDDEIYTYNWTASSSTDYDNVFGQTHDPYNSDVPGFKLNYNKKSQKEEKKNYNTWRIMHNGFRFEKMPRELKNRLKQDAEDSKDITPVRGGPPITKIYKDFRKKKEAAHYAIDALNQIDPRIDYFMVTGGYAKICLSEFLDVVRKTPNNIRLFSKYIIVSDGISYETLKQSRSHGFVKTAGTEKIMRHKYQHYLDNF